MHYWIKILKVRTGRVYSMHEGKKKEVGNCIWGVGSTGTCLMAILKLVLRNSETVNCTGEPQDRVL
jgi:hypothetical protein